MATGFQNKYKFIKFRLFFLSIFLFWLSEHANGISYNRENICIEEIIGNFIVEPVSNNIWYRKLVDFSTNSHSRLNGKSPIPELLNCGNYRLELFPLKGNGNYEEGLENVSSLSYTPPLVVKKSFENSTKNRKKFGKLKLPEYKEITYTKYFHGPEGKSKIHSNKSIAFTPQIESKLYLDHLQNGVRSNQGFKLSTYIKNINDIQTIKNDEFIISKIQNPTLLTANNCWLIKSDASYFDEGARGTGTSEVKKNLKILSLFHQDSQEKTNEEKCNSPFFLEDETGRASETIYNNAKSWDNPLPTGLDFDAFSHSPKTLDIVYQMGFNRNADEEKKLSGDLILRRYQREESHIRQSEIKLLGKSINITSGCYKLFNGWEYSPSYSQDGKIIFFLSQKKEGEDSSKSDLYSVQVSKLLDSRYQCNEDINSLTSNFNFNEPIRFYRVSKDQRSLIIVYEKRGASIVRFFRMNPHSGMVVHKETYEISWNGYIYDVVGIDSRSLFDKFDTYYIMASKLNSQKKIYICRLVRKSFKCEGEAHIAGKPFSLEELLKVNKHPDNTKVMIEELTIPSTHAQPDIHTFVLRPDKKNANGKAIVSIHGGPNEAWDGRFSRREYLLAKLGYTVFMPNPTGSTGYGFTYTSASANSWGSKIYNDIRDVINYVSNLGDFPKVIVKGFSFGGYMVNWLQSRPASEKSEFLNSVKAFIAINPVFDLTDFASSTDQYWFPEHELGCSGGLCAKLSACEIPHNPACNFGCQNDSTFPKIPTYFIVGDVDERVPKCANAQKMLKAYNKSGIPYIVEAPYEAHGLSAVRNHNIALRIDQWIKGLEELEEKENNSPNYLNKYVDCENELSSKFDNCKSVKSALSCNIFDRYNQTQNVYE